VARLRTYSATYRRTGGTLPVTRPVRADSDSAALARAQHYLGAAGAAAGWRVVELAHGSRSWCPA
jgi:hypothetical protein